MTPPGLASYTPAGRAAIEAVTVERSIGRPVFLRFVDDAESEDGLFQGVAGGIDLASRCLGPAESLYATAHRERSGTLTYLAATVRCSEGAVAQVGAGIAHGRRSIPGLLLIGDQGTLESNLAASGVVYEDDRPGIPLRDEREETQRAWERGSRDATGAREARLIAVLAAIRRSLASGRLEMIEGDS